MLRHVALILRWGLGQVPSVIVFSLLGILLYWGHCYHWKVPRFAQLHGQLVGGDEEEAEEPPEADPATVVTPVDEGPVLSRLQLPSTDVLRKIGVRLEAAREQPLDLTVTANGVVGYDQTRVAQLTARVPGIVWRVEKTVGARVRKGDLLAVLDASDVGRTKSEYLQAVVQTDLKAKILERLNPSIVPDRAIQEARAALREAQIRRFNARQALINLGLGVRDEEAAGKSDEELARWVQFLGLPASLPRGLDPDTTTANLLPVFAPFDGVLTGCSIVAGEGVVAAGSLFEVADVRTMWVELDVRLEDAALIDVAQSPRVTFTSDAARKVKAEGVVTWMSTAADEKTRTVRARAEIDNPGGRFRANTFGTGQIQVCCHPHALVVPAQAVQRDGTHHVVFVSTGEAAFEARRVKVGVQIGRLSEILSGLRAGETVVTDGSHVLKSEVVRSRLLAQE